MEYCDRDEYTEAFDLGEVVACPYCGAGVPLPEPRLVMRGDYDAPAEYEPVLTTCPRCGREV